MHAGRNFSLKEVLYWTRRHIYAFFLLATLPTVAYAYLGIQWIVIPWLPIAMLGTAVAFLVGFKNNATYDRLWEARKIWGAIVNTSRTWGIMSRDYVTNKHAAKALPENELNAQRLSLVMRHLAWLTALRFQLRQPRVWENSGLAHNVEYRRFYEVQEHDGTMADALRPLLNAEEFETVMKAKNAATQIIALQSLNLRNLHEKGLIEDFRHIELKKQLSDMLAHQGASERIKNFPYPRQFATLNLLFVWLFIVLLPFGMLQEFEKMGSYYVWLTIPFSALVAWVFHTMDKIGESSENPFEGGANDVPLTALCRTIEIDLRQMLGETELPEPLAPVNNILM